MNKYHARDWKLERYLLGELPKKELKALAALEQSDSAVRDRLDALRKSDAEILKQYPPAAMARNLMAALEARQKRPASGKAAPSGKHASAQKTGLLWNWAAFSRWAVPAFACAAALIIIPARVFQPSVQTAPDNYGEDGVRVKGLSPALEVWRKEGESAEKLAPQAVARTGDIVQLRYIVPEFCYGALVSVDGRGVLTVHLSGDSGKAAPLTPGRPVALGSSYQLDDAPEFETFYLVTAPDNFNVRDVSEALNRAGQGRVAGAKMPGKRKIIEFTLLK